MLIRLCSIILFCFIIANDIKSNTLQVPFMMALNFGKNLTNDGTVAGAGIKCLFRIITTRNTKTDIAVTNRNMNLSVMNF
jgi:hypothetical protein